jgi:hypothetical protein
LCDIGTDGSERVIATVVSLILVSMFLVMGLLFFVNIQDGRKRSHASMNQLKSRMIAESAIEHAKRLLIQAKTASNYITFCFLSTADHLRVLL